MAASTEVRVPFVDLEVFRAAFSIPGSRKIRGRTRKVALREAAAEQWLPKEIVLERPKASFGAPLRGLGDERPRRRSIDDVLLDGELVAAGAAPARRRCVQLVADERSGREDQSKQIWQLLSLELWYQQRRAAASASRD